MPAQQPDAHTIDMVVLIIASGALAIGLISMLVGRVVAWWDRVRGVNAFVDGDADFMSREGQDGRAHAAPSLQTDGRQTADRPTMAALTREQMLDIFRVLRQYGVKRDAIVGPWRAAGLKFDNNLWTEAAPGEPPTITPIAQRPTNAKFYDDSELEYEPLR